MNRCSFVVAVAVSVLLATAQARQFYAGIINPSFVGYLKGHWPEPSAPEAPELPQYQHPDVPDYSFPSVPGVPAYERPEAPEYARPSVPDVPEYKAPDAPEISKPVIPSAPVQPDQPPKPSGPEYSQTKERSVPNVPSQPDQPQAPGAPDSKPGQPPVPEAPGAPDSKPEQPPAPDAPNSAPVQPPVPSVPNYSRTHGRVARGAAAYQPQQPSVPEGSAYSLPDLPGLPSDVQAELPAIPGVSDYSVPQPSALPEYSQDYPQPDYDHMNHYYPQPSNDQDYANLGHPVFDVDYNPKYEQQQNATEGDYEGAYNHPAYAQPDNGYYAPEYGYDHDYQRSNVVEGEGSYYRLDTCEYRFILDMVQCHQEEHHEEKIHYQSQGSDSYHQHHQAPNYDQKYDYDNRVPYFSRLYGNPSGYSHNHKQPGHYDSSLFAYQPSVGNPFYAPGLHNTPFARYYAGFRNAHLDENHESGRRAYHKDGYYQTALQDFNNLRLQNVVNITEERDASEKTSTKVSTSAPQAYEGVTPYFNYNVRLMPNHCSLPGLAGRHTCIVFNGATHPYKNVQRQFIYVTKAHELQDKYRFRYEDGQSRSHH